MDDHVEEFMDTSPMAPDGPAGAPPGLAEVPTAPTEDVLEGIRVLKALQEFNRRVYLGQPVSDTDARDVQQAVAGFYTKWYKYGRM